MLQIQDQCTEISDKTQQQRQRLIEIQQTINQIRHNRDEMTLMAIRATTTGPGTNCMTSDTIDYLSWVLFR